MSSVAVRIIEYSGEFVKQNAKYVIAVTTASASSAVVATAVTKKQDEKIIFKEKQSSYRAGIRKGIELKDEAIRSSFVNPLLAQIAVAYYMARIDGKISKEEQAELDNLVNSILQSEFPDYIVKEVQQITVDKKLTFDKVSVYLDKVEASYIAKLLDVAYDMVYADGKKSNAEKKGINELEEYLFSREETFDLPTQTEFFSYEDVRVPEVKIEKAVQEYSWRMKMLDRAFEKKTKLNKMETALLMVAVCLQCLRIYGVNYLTTIEKAGKGKKESFLHQKQEQLLSSLAKSNREKAQKYYAPMDQILLTKGVPYDATNYTDKQLKLFKGANHRFSTLGHDPILGLVIGTANIMTNTITVKNEEKLVPMSYHVEYDSKFKNPKITKPAELLTAIEKIAERTKEDQMPLVAALIKQLIHIATDIYTPAGIQLPGSSLVLSRKNVELVTSYISTGDLAKLQVSSGMEQLIDTLISIIHGCILVESGADIDDKMNEIKCRKIITYANAISSGSNLIEKMVTQQYNQLDFPGLVAMFTRAFSDIKFQYDVKYEFIRNGLGEL